MDRKPSRDWYKWFPKSYQVDTKLLSDGADLLYRRLLDEYWIDAKLPNNARTLQKLCRYSARKWQRFFPEIANNFVQNGDYLIHIRIEEQLSQAVDNSEKARHSANIRWAKIECERNANAYANGMPRAREEIEIEKEIEKESERKSAKSVDNFNGHDLGTVGVLPQTPTPKKSKKKKKPEPDWSKIENLNQDAWSLYLAYRNEVLGKPRYKVDTRARMLADYPQDVQMEAVLMTCETGGDWTGIFPNRIYNLQTGQRR